LAPPRSEPEDELELELESESEEEPSEEDEEEEEDDESGLVPVALDPLPSDEVESSSEPPPQKRFLAASGSVAITAGEVCW
jgi:hypothetical protein